MAIYNSTVKQRLPSVDAIFLNNSLKYRKINILKYSTKLQMNFDLYNAVEAIFEVDNSVVSKYKFYRCYVIANNLKISNWTSDWKTATIEHFDWDFQYLHLLDKQEYLMDKTEHTLSDSINKTITLYIEQTNYINS